MPAQPPLPKEENVDPDPVLDELDDLDPKDLTLEDLKRLAAHTSHLAQGAMKKSAKLEELQNDPPTGRMKIRKKA